MIKGISKIEVNLSVSVTTPKVVRVKAHTRMINGNKVKVRSHLRIVSGR